MQAQPYMEFVSAIRGLSGRRKDLSPNGVWSGKIMDKATAHLKDELKEHLENIGSSTCTAEYATRSGIKSLPWINFIFKESPWSLSDTDAET